MARSKKTDTAKTTAAAATAEAKQPRLLLLLRRPHVSAKLSASACSTAAWNGQQMF